MLIWQFAKRRFPGLVHFVFPAVPVSPTLPLIWQDITLSLSCQHGNIAVTSTIDNVKSVAP
jgi:hypothetical protein